jgi:Concanavalin A-like lectin/glucanases superfamily
MGEAHVIRTMLVVCLLGALHASGDDAPAGRWDFGEGRDSHIHDGSGHANHGLAEGTKWVELAAGYALEFNGKAGHVNCGNGPGLDITGPVTLQAWVFPNAPAGSETGICGKSFTSYGLTCYTNGKVYWYVSSGGNKCSAPLKTRTWTHVAGTFDGKNMALYLDGELADTVESQFDAVKHGGDFLIGCIGGDSRTASFKGAIGSVCVHSRALSEQEVRAQYEAELGRYPGPPATYDRLVVWPFYYLDQGKVVLDADLCALLPLRDGELAWAELRREGTQEPGRRQPLPEIPKSGVLRDVTFETGALEDGAYELRVTIEGPGGEIRGAWRDTARHPRHVALPAPTEQAAPPLPALPAPAGPVAYGAAPGELGGFTVDIDGRRYAVESTFTYPHGGANALAAAKSKESECEASWAIETHPIDDTSWRVSAKGAFYTIERVVERRPAQVLVKDTITNTSGAALGIMLSNHIMPEDPADLLAEMLPNPSVFLQGPGQGIGIVALDDVYLEHHKTFSSEGRHGIRDDMFGLEAAGSYTLEWAVYPNGTGDYYDFVNAARQEEGHVPTVEGGFAFTDRRETPSEDYVSVRALRYASIGCLGHVPDDPGLSLEGVEFVEYPEECALLKETIARTRAQYPDMKVMFHIAHSLYTTNKPDELFPDARTLNASRVQTDYGSQNTAYYAKYFSQARVDEGYRWYIFYPAMDNSFGPYMLDAVDYMLDEIGANGMFADGFTHGYGGRFTYDRWDGHTVEIDPATKTITRKLASVNLLAQGVLIEVIRRIEAAGGVVIANSYPGTRSIHREHILYCLETAAGGKVCSRLHFAPSVIALGNPSGLNSDRDVYDDIRDKLEWGGLYFYYGEKSVSPGTIVTRMYPITVESIHAGIIRGQERIVTLRPGVYGWRGDNALHLVHYFDGRGEPVPHGFITTAGDGGARTALPLGDKEAAVVERIPVALEASQPVNARVEAYGPACIRLLLNGHGEVRVTVTDGAFPVRAGTDYTARAGDSAEPVIFRDGALALTVALRGETDVEITPL